MYQLAHVANTILYRAKKEDIEVSPMKLQKLIYFLYGEYLYKENEHLFSERFEAWKYGPVLDDVYQAFRSRGSKRIKSYMLDANGQHRMIDTDCNRCFRRCLDDVWDMYSSKTGIELSNMTHRADGAWYAAVSRNDVFLDDKDILKEMRIIDDEQRSRRNTTNRS